MTQVPTTMSLLHPPISHHGMSSLAIKIRAGAQLLAARFLPQEIVVLTTCLMTSSLNSFTHGLSK